MCIFNSLHFKDDYIESYINAYHMLLSNINFSGGKEVDESNLSCLKAAMLLPAGLDLSCSGKATSSSKQSCLNPARWCIDMQAKISWL